LLYREIQKQKKVATQGKAIDLLGYQLKPNSMQLNFIQNLQKLREEGQNRALLISATGERVIIVIPHGSAANTRASAA
ncbi:MAG: HKD family nuclease, partial [Wujia sp.]|nr:HKD family nuclease [Wujia sp.]